MPAPIIAAAAPVVGGIVGRAVGPKSPKTQAMVPPDLAPLRNQQIQLLMRLLGGPGNAQSRLEGFFGPLSSQQQQTSQNFLSNLVNMQRPEQRTLEALQPSFDRNLAAANQTGGRFGSSNALLRGRALEDFNMLGAQVSQQAQQQQLQAAQLLSSLGQNDVNTRLNLLQSLLGTAQGASFNLPIGTTPSGFQQGVGLGQGVGDIITQFTGGMKNSTSPVNQGRGNRTQSGGR